MLVITRNEGQSFVIGNHIEVHIAKINNGHVKVSIDAPKEVKILRSELIAVGNQHERQP